MLKILTHDSDKHLPHRPGPARARVVVRVKNGVDNKNTWNSQSHIQHHQGLLAHPGLSGRHTALAGRPSFVFGFALPNVYSAAGSLHLSAMFVHLNLLLLLRVKTLPPSVLQPVNFTPPSDPALSAVIKPVKASLNVSLSVL